MISLDDSSEVETKETNMNLFLIAATVPRFVSEENSPHLNNILVEWILRKLDVSRLFCWPLSSGNDDEGGNLIKNMLIQSATASAQYFRRARRWKMMV